MKKLFICLILLMISQPGLARDSEKNNNFIGVHQALQKYFDGTSKGTPALLKEVFTEDLTLQFIRDNKRVTWQGKDYIAGFEEGVKYQREGRVVSIDITQNAAMVKTEIEMGDNIYVDYLLLLKEGEHWKITHKIFSKR